MEELKELQERVARLERERWWLVSVVVVMAISFLLIGAVSSRKAQVTDKVQTRELVIVDQDGNPRARLGLDTDGNPFLRFADVNGKMRGWIGVEESIVGEGSFVGLYDAAGKPRVILGAGNFSGYSNSIGGLGNVEGSLMGLCDATGKARVVLAAGNFRSSFFSMDGSIVGVGDAAGRPRVILGAGNYKRPLGLEGLGLLVLDDVARPQAWLGTGSVGSLSMEGSVLSFFDTAGNPVWMAP